MIQKAIYMYLASSLTVVLHTQLDIPYMNHCCECHLMEKQWKWFHRRKFRVRTSASFSCCFIMLLQCNVRSAAPSRTKWMKRTETHPLVFRQKVSPGLEYSFAGGPAYLGRSSQGVDDTASTGNCLWDFFSVLNKNVTIYWIIFCHLHLKVSVFIFLYVMLERFIHLSTYHVKWKSWKLWYCGLNSFTTAIITTHYSSPKQKHTHKNIHTSTFGAFGD